MKKKKISVKCLLLPMLFFSRPLIALALRWHEQSRPPTALRCRHVQTVRDSTSSYKIDHVIVIRNFLNPEGQQNPISGSKVTAILLKGWILPICGASAGECLRLQPAQQACFLIIYESNGYRSVWLLHNKIIWSSGVLHHHPALEWSSDTCGERIWPEGRKVAAGAKRGWSSRHAPSWRNVSWSWWNLLGHSFRLRVEAWCKASQNIYNFFIFSHLKLKLCKLGWEKIGLIHHFKENRGFAKIGESKSNRLKKTFFSHYFSQKKQY